MSEFTSDNVNLAMQLLFLVVVRFCSAPREGRHFMWVQGYL